MERLTHQGEHGPYWDKSVFGKHGGMEEDLIIDRLAAYEDTGMEPGEIKDLQVRYRNQYESLTFLLCETDCEISHVKELLSAEKEGRLVVLPCKVGDIVWFIRPLDSKKEITETEIEKMVVKGRGIYMKLSCNAMYETSCNSIGKTVFLTREEAEAALRG